MDFRLAGTKDANLLILSKMDDRTLLSYCKTNRYSKNLCNNEDFWRNRFIKVYGVESANLKNKNRTWKDYYLSVLYYTNKYTDEKASEKVLEKGYMDLFKFFSKDLSEYKIKEAIISSGNKDLIYNIDSIDDHLQQLGLLRAARKGDRELMNFYLSKGANPIMALMGAVMGNQLNIFKEFDKRVELDPNLGLKLSAYAGNTELIDLFISRGANEWNDALEYAAMGGYKNIIDFLIQKGANNWQNGLNGATAGGQNKLIDFFISKGAEIGLHVELIAKSSGNKDTIAYIEKLEDEGY